MAIADIEVSESPPADLLSPSSNDSGVEDAMNPTKPLPEAEDARLPSLVVVFGATNRKRRSLTKVATVLGRSRLADIRLDAPEVANVHCIITRGIEGVVVRDCDSRVGTLLNGQPIRESKAQHGDILQLGPFSFRIEVPQVPAAESALDPAGHDNSLADREQALAQRQEELDRRSQNHREVAAKLREQEEQLRRQQQEFARQAIELEERVRAVEERALRMAEEEKRLSEGIHKLVEDQRQLSSQHLSASQQWRELQAELAECEREASHSLNGTAPVDQALSRQRLEEELLLPLRTENEALARQNAELDDECARLRTEVEHLQSLVDNAIDPSELIALRDERDQLRNAVAELEQKFARLEREHQVEYDEHERRLAALRADLDQERGRVKELLKEAASHFQHASPDVAELRKRLEAAELELAESRQWAVRAQELEAELEQLRQGGLPAGSALPALPPDLAEYEQQLHEFRAQLEWRSSSSKPKRPSLARRFAPTSYRCQKSGSNWPARKPCWNGREKSFVPS